MRFPVDYSESCFTGLDQSKLTTHSSASLEPSSSPSTLHFVPSNWLPLSGKLQLLLFLVEVVFAKIQYFHV